MTSETAAQEGSVHVEDVRSALLAFFDKHARDLPWRENTDPYRVWISEIMLQQTRVETVVPYYNRWMDRFPTATALADAPLESVLELWAGLGYYSRARNLHQAATLVREHYGGSLPDNPEQLRSLPGIGEYTAGAIGSIAFAQPVPAVDGNVRRVLSRLCDLPAPTPARLRSHASGLVDPERPGDFNQAVMELGATVCKPRQPDCSRCPVSTWCLALARGTVGERPPIKAKKPIPSQRHAVVVVRMRTSATDEEVSTVLKRRPPSGLLGGMLEFPSVQLSDGPSSDDTRREVVNVAEGLLDSLAVDLPEGTVVLEPVRHRFSHLEIVYHPVVFDIQSGAERLLPTSRDSSFRELGWPALDSAALPAAQRRIANAAEAVVWGKHK